jgi:large subunit ribosomal protein L25
MQSQSLQAEVRASRGKGPARRMRAAGQIPAVFYGPGQESTALAVSPKELTAALSGTFGRNQVLNLKLDGKESLAMVRDLCVHPVSRELRHADFYALQAGRAIIVEVPFRTTGKAAGLQEGGKVSLTLHTVHVRCVPGKIPEAVVADITHLNLNESLAVSDLKLPEGIEVLAPADLTLAAVAEPRVFVEETEGEDGEDAAAPGAAAAATPDA